MRVSARLVADRTLDHNISGFVRIIAGRHAATPLGVGYGSSRFSSPSCDFAVLYAAEDFDTAFAEAVVRDRLTGKRQRTLYRPSLEHLAITEIRSRLPLPMIDLRGDSAYALGIDTDAVRARSHDIGQQLAAALHQLRRPLVQGIVFESRLTGRTCVAVYDRSLRDLEATTAVALTDDPRLVPTMLKRGINLRKARATSATFT